MRADTHPRRRLGSLVLLAAVGAILLVLAFVSQEDEGPGASGGALAPTASAPDTEPLAEDELPQAPSTEEPAPLTLVEDVAAVAPELATPVASGARLRVFVVDEEDEPLADVPIALRATHAGSFKGFDLVTANSDENGQAVLELQMKGIENGQLSQPDVSFALAVALPLVPPVVVDLGRSVEIGQLRALTVPRSALAWLEPVRVLVVNAAQEPVSGVDVELQTVQRFNPSDPRTIERVTTDPSGMAVLSRARLIEHRQSIALLDMLVDERVTLDGPFDSAPVARLDPVPSSEVVRLQLPPSCSVEVVVLDPSGVPLESGPSVALFTRPVDADDDMRWERSHHHIAAVEEGVARFPHVGLGLALRLSVSQSGWQGASLHANGPMDAGQLLSLETTLGNPLPVFTGRVVDELGEPAAGVKLGISILGKQRLAEQQGSHRSGGYTLYVTCDEQGVFRAPYGGESFLEGGRVMDVVEQRPKRGFAKGTWPRTAEVELSAILPEPLPSEGDLDLGVIQLGLPPLLVSGRVVNAQGGRSGQVYLRIRYTYGSSGKEQWSNLNVAGSSRISTDAQGVFEVRGMNRVLELMVSAGISPEVTVLPGATDVLIQIPDPVEEPERGIVTGRVLLDEHVPPLNLEVFLRRKGANHENYVWPGGLLHLKNVRPGVYTLRIETQTNDFLMVEREGVEVFSGETTTLDDIDLRGALDVAHLRLLKPNGKPFTETTGWVGTETDGGGSFRTNRDGQVSLLLPTQYERFMIRANGYELLEFAWADSEQTLMLQVEQDEPGR